MIRQNFSFRSAPYVKTAFWAENKFLRNVFQVLFFVLFGITGHRLTNISHYQATISAWRGCGGVAKCS